MEVFKVVLGFLVFVEDTALMVEVVGFVEVVFKVVVVLEIVLVLMVVLIFTVKTQNFLSSIGSDSNGQLWLL
ncbi:hypothetical protein BpHYR1_048840 [Brachionus plicatilis]|uniref:Uncharacterized protein n=1 Tax=Brachionus plicatilis TaxID=10195 RepID=A0A3M7S5X2_BRAPC|nr:hypothetical protein BpHYR1_048840 [Brachionus plicatilis]